MKSEAEFKLSKIADIWNHYIWEYKFCSSKINFTDIAKTNYFGDILGYLQDTFEVVFQKKEIKNQSDQFAAHISLLQAIYVHQDFIEEFLILFKTKLVKGDLLKDKNYFINRELRNELVGHPFRKHNGELISTVLFSYHAKEGTIEYLRYHKDNDYKFEMKSYEISEIIDRHQKFLNTYFDIILRTLESILKKFAKEIEAAEKVLENNDFEAILKVASAKFESIFGSDYLYRTDYLLEIYKRRNEHNRYQNVIDVFLEDLKRSLAEKKQHSKEIFFPAKVYEVSEMEKPLFDIEFVDSLEFNLKSSNALQKVNYSYELGKLWTKRNPIEFDLHGGTLAAKCANNGRVLDELEHMRLNMYDDVEYYSAIRLISSLLKEDD